jgi:Spy/CpxP family protein refolding chaperone
VNWQAGVVQLEAALRYMGLTEDQQANLERVIEAHGPTVSRAGEQLEAEETALERLLDAEPVDSNAVFTQLDVVIRARGDLERANTAMLLEFREYITRDQWEQFQRIWGYGQGISLRLRPTEAPAGFGGGRGGRGGPRGAETPQ